MPQTYVIIIVTCSTLEEAEKIASRILAERLAACANIIKGVDSRFWWKGKIDEASEVIVMKKTLKKNFKKIETQVKRIHSYELPEIIAIPITAGSKDYLGWIRKNVKV